MLPDHCHRRIDILSTAALSRSTEMAASLASGILSAADAARFDAIVRRLVVRLAGRDGGGTILMRRFGRHDGVECIALDRGPGFADSDAALAEGGADGLAEIRRLSDEFALHSDADCGTAVLLRVAGPGRDRPSCRGLRVVEGGAVMSVPPGVGDCAAGWLVRPDGLAALIGGNAGLQSDPARSAAQARRIETVVSATVSGIPTAMVIGAVRQACGAGPEINVAALRLTGDAVDYTALGSVPAAVVRGQGVTSLSARWAMIGYNPHVPGCVHLDWAPGDHVVLSSEGCGRLPGLFIRRRLHDTDPTLAAAVLMRDGEIPPGDHTVMVLRNVSGG